MIDMTPRLKSDNMNRLSNKNEFIALDFFRLICALGVVAIHLCPLKEISLGADYFLGQVLARVCVPFFFLTSGFFMQNKIHNYEKIKAYVLHLAKMYLLYSLLYLPQVIYEYINSDDSFIHNLLSYIKRFLLVGSYTQLWYFLALIAATILLYFMITKIDLSDKTVFVIVTVLYIIGVLGNAYIEPLRENLSINNHPVLWLYFKIFSTTRNGLFFGLPYVFWGYLISKNKERIIKRKYWVYALIFFVAMTGEAFVAHEYFGYITGQDMLFFLPATAVMLFLSICFIKGNSKHSAIAQHCRKTSVLFFGFHMFFFFYLKSILHNFFDFELNGILSYFTVVIVNYVAAVLIIEISKKKGMHWLKKFF